MARSRSSITDDLIIEILSRLPADSFVRFKCVQKSWSSLIESEFFMKLQLRNHVYSDDNSSTCLLVKSSSEYGMVNTLSLFTHDRRNNAFSPMKDVDLSVCKNYTASLRTINVEGYICFYDGHSENIAIANPGIRKFCRLPESSVPSEDCSCLNGLVGIGIDPNTNDLKIVRVLNICFSETLSPLGNRAEVYTLSSNSWRQVDFPGQLVFIFQSAFHETRMDSHWNGAYYWTVLMESYTHKEGHDYWVCGILSFDMSDEAFQFRPLPDFVSRPDDIGILEYNDTLALISFSPGEEGMEEKWFELWSLDDFGVQGTLTEVT